MHIRLKSLAIIPLGAMIFLVGGLLSGCGSDSTKLESKKIEKTRTSSTDKKSSGMVGPLLSDKGKTASPKTGDLREVFPGVTQEQLEARIAAERKIFEAQKNRAFLPGIVINEKQLEDRMASERKKFESQKRREVLPGITQEELNSRITQRQKTANTEVFPGVTQVEMDGRKTAEQRKGAQKGNEIAPGLTKN
jgi:hypothetical protein